jgi:uncharacterized protein YacL
MSADRIDRIIRIVAFIVCGIIGWQVGMLWANTTEVTLASLKYVIPLAVGFALLGALVAPWLTTRPAAWVVRSVRETTAGQLLAATIGLVIGLIIAALLALPLSYLPPPFRGILPTIVAIIFGWLGITIMVLRQKDFLALFRRRSGPGDIESGPEQYLPIKGNGHAATDAVLLDTSVVIDGRIADIAKTGFIRSPMLVPRFVLAELQYIADSADPLRRNRGRRGLEMLNQMQRESPVPVQIIDADVEGARQVDAKLIELAHRMSCPIVTNDYNLNRVAGLQGIAILNINELSNAVKAVVLPGETMDIRVIQEGKEVGQGIGYLDDGTMVVVENGRRFMDSTIAVTVTKVLQTNAGRMIFAVPNR